MTAAHASAIRDRALARWGRKVPKDLEEPMGLLSTLQQTAKPEAVLGPALNTAALTISRRLREEEA
jgi:hypothetical protein